jgi:hypothetical protein
MYPMFAHAAVMRLYEVPGQVLGLQSTTEKRSVEPSADMRVSTNTAASTPNIPHSPLRMPKSLPIIVSISCI